MTHDGDPRSDDGTYGSLSCAEESILPGVWEQILIDLSKHKTQAFGLKADGGR